MSIFFLICLVQEPDPNQPKPEGQQMSPLDGEHIVINKLPPSLPAALQRWGTTQPKSPCLTALDNAGKPVYTLTYGRFSSTLWMFCQCKKSLSFSLSFTLIHFFCVMLCV